MVVTSIATKIQLTISIIYSRTLTTFIATEKFKKYAPSSLPITDQKIPRELSSPCPFCSKTSINLGKHISKYRESDGRDYSPHLAKKTLDKKAKSELPKKSRCPKCHRLFLRLDTHLRKNPFCKSVKDHEKLLTSEPQFQPPFNNHSETIPPTSLLIDNHSPTHTPSTELTNGQLQLEPLSHKGILSIIFQKHIHHHNL